MPWRHRSGVVAIATVMVVTGIAVGSTLSASTPVAPLEVDAAVALSPGDAARVASPTTQATPPGVRRRSLVSEEPINAPGQRLVLERLEVAPRAALPSRAPIGTVLMRVERGRIRFVVSRGSAIVTDRRGTTRTVTAPAELTVAKGDSVVELPLGVYSAENRSGRRFVAAIASLHATVVPGPVPPEGVQSPPITLTTEIRSASSSLTNADASLRYGWNNLVGDATLGDDTVHCTMLGNVSYVSGAGPFFGFVTYTWPDGSSLVTQMFGESAPQPDGGAVVSAMLTIIGGTGRFSAATGYGSFLGIRDAAVGAPVRSVFTLTPAEP